MGANSIFEPVPCGKATGVECLTVYRHFPDEASLHQACQQHFFASHPLPNLELWREVSTFPNRLAVGLSELYEYWQQTHEMFSNVLRDHEVDPERSGAGVVRFMSRASDALLGGQDISGHHGEMLRAAVGHAVHFYTWRSLVIAQGLSKADAAELMCETILSGRTQCDRLWTLVRPAPYEESEKFMSRVLEVWAGDPMPGVSEEDARTRLGEIKKLILTTGATEVLILDVWMGKNEHTYTMIITYESAASFGKIQGEKQDGTAWKNAMKTFRASPKVNFTFGSTYFETDI